MLTTIRTRALVFEGDNDEQALIVVLVIECEQCGEYSVVLPGHHIRGVLSALQRIADLKPELTPVGEVTETPIHIQKPMSN